VTGSSLSTRAGPATVGALEDLRLTAEWLAAFHRQTTIESVAAREWVTRRLVNGMCPQYAATFGLTGAERRLFATLSRRLETAEAGVLPIVWQHTDFGPWNVYRDRHRVSVIDWERARRGPALPDLLYFVTHWSAAVAARATDAERREHFKSLFCGTAPGGTLARAVRGEIAKYMRRVTVPASLFASLLVYTFVEQALDRACRLTEFGRADATHRAGNSYVGYVDILAQHADSLFGGDASDGL
jgi:hypothetical protein